MNIASAKQTITTLSFGALGGVLAWYAGFPAPFLTGSAIAVTLACLSGLVLDIPGFIRNICFIAIGLSMGAGVTPEVLETLGIWPVAFVILSLSLLGTFFGCRWILSRFWQFDRRSAILASSPGHLSFILGLSSQSNVDIPAISIVQSIRVMVLTVVVPFAVALLGLAEGQGGPRPPHMELVALISLVPVALALGWVLLKVKAPAAYLLGGMIASTVAHATALVEGQIPTWLAIMAFTIMGSIIGTRFSNISFKQLRRAAGAGLASVSVAAIMAIAAGSFAAWLLDMPLAQLLIAFAPGGLEAMAAMAVIMDVDTTFVAAQHVFRLFLLTFLAPIVLAYEDRRNSSN